MGQRPNRDKTKISQFQGCCLPMAESLLVSPTGNSAFPIGSSKTNYNFSVTAESPEKNDQCATTSSPLTP
jgi:hypothetical protein